MLDELKARILSRCKSTPSGCMEWSGSVDGCGYGTIRSNGVLVKTHRIMADAPKGTEVLHSCDNPRCCNVEHLSLGTHADNMIDRSRKNRMGKQQKLTPEQVRAIRKSNKRICDLAREYGVVHSCIINIQKRRRWAWLED